MSQEMYRGQTNFVMGSADVWHVRMHFHKTHEPMQRVSEFCENITTRDNNIQAPP